MVSDIFGVITSAVTAFASSLSTALTSIGSMFYTPASGTGTTGSFTLLGTLCLIGVGIALIYWAFRLIRGLLKKA